MNRGRCEIRRGPYSDIDLNPQCKLEIGHYGSCQFDLLPQEEAKRVAANLQHLMHNIRMRFGFDIEKTGYDGVLHRLLEIADGTRPVPQAYNVGTISEAEGEQ